MAEGTTHLTQIVKDRTDPQLINLLSRVMKYDPQERLSPEQALLHPYFDELRDEKNYRLLTKKYAVPDLFNFSKSECSLELIEQLTPAWYPLI